MWPFTRKPKVEDRREWNEDWAVGDLAALREDITYWPMQKGEVLRVCDINETTGELGYWCYFLEFEGYPGSGYECTAFRKIRPVHAKATHSIKEMIRVGERA